MDYYWELNDQQRRSFVKWNPEFKTVNRQTTLLSFSTRTDRCEGPPMYWMEKEVVIECIEKAQREDDLNGFYEFIRQGVALREDWGNSLKYAFELNVNSDTQVNAWVGYMNTELATEFIRGIRRKTRMVFDRISIYSKRIDPGISREDILAETAQAKVMIDKLGMPNKKILDGEVTFRHKRISELGI